MNVAPITEVIASRGLFLARNGKALFIKKHGQSVNLASVKTQTSCINTNNPDQWLFLIEGHKRYHSGENLYLDKMAEELKIVTEDPIDPPFTSQVSEEASVDKIVAALAVLVMDYFDFIEQNHNIEETPEETLEILFHNSLDAVAKAFGVNVKALRKQFQELNWQDEHSLAEQLKVLSLKRKQLIDVSNSRSRINLARILNMHRHPNLFIMSGIEHKLVFVES